MKGNNTHQLLAALFSLLSIPLFFCSFFPYNKISNTLEKNEFLHSQYPKKNRTLQDIENEVEKYMRTLSLEEQIGQLIIPVLYPSSDEQKIAEARRLLNSIHAGGVLFQKGEAYDQYIMCKKLQESSPLPLLVSADNEWGLAMRLSGTIRYPRNMALSQSSEEEIYQYGKSVAQQCKTIGINVSFAPVMDINNNPRNPVIGTRSFGENPSTVTRLAIAYAKGMESEGVLSVAKHFPGHGNTTLDSHKTLPIIRGSKTDLAQCELIPFKAYIASDLGGIMTGHLCVPAYDKSGTPASMSQAITSQLLVNDLGFKGLIFTDGLAMSGAAMGIGNIPIGVKAVLAGNDILLGPKDPLTCYKSLVNAVKKGVITKEQIAIHCKKILLRKFHFFYNSLHESQNKPILNRSDFYNELNKEYDCNIADQLWLNSIHIEKKANTSSAETYFDNKTRLGILNIGSNGGSKRGFSQALQEIKLHPKVELTVQSKDIFSIPSVMKAFKDCDLIFVNVHQPSLTSAKIITEKISEKKNVIFTFFGSPYQMDSWKKASRKAIIKALAYENCTEAGRAAASKLLQATSSKQPTIRIVLNEYRKGISHYKEKQAIKDQSPVSTHLHRKVASIAGDARFSKIDTIVQEGLNIKAFPGCQVVVIHKGQLVYNKAFGHLEYSTSSPAVTPSTLYDVASISKAVVTTPAIMKLVGDKLIRLSDPIEKYLSPLKGSAAGRISIKELLLHESGLPSGINFYESLVDINTLPDGKLFSYRAGKNRKQIDNHLWVATDFKFDSRFISKNRKKGFSQPFADNLYVSDSFKDIVLQRVAQTPLKKKKQSRYSDVGFILLGMLIEKVSGVPLDTYVYNNFFAPMHLGSALFRPTEKIGKTEIAPTQANNFLRGKVWGIVDDESAASLGGVAGNAGLFANAIDIGSLGLWLMDNGVWGDQQLLHKKIVTLFRTVKSRDGKRVMGFSVKYPNNPYIPDVASSNTFGHTGFTGTCLWVDPDNDLVFVFLSNRTFPIRSNNLLGKENFRYRIFEAVYDSLLSSHQL